MTATNVRFKRPSELEEVPAARSHPGSALAAYIADFQRALASVDPAEIDELVDILSEARDERRLVFVIGNGGSGANASHFSQDLAKATLHDPEHQTRLRTMSLADGPATILAWANDTSFERIFVEQLKSLADPGCVLIAISGSGASANILRAVEYANALDMVSVGVTGFDGGPLRKIAGHSVHVPSFDMGIVEGAHSVIFHCVVDVLSRRFRTELTAGKGTGERLPADSPTGSRA